MTSLGSRPGSSSISCVFGRLLSKAATVTKPPPELTVSEWADRYRKLSPESSASPGQWRTENAPYQQKMMDAANSSEIKELVLMCSAQIGKTEIINNTVGFFIDQDPSTILLLQPTLEMAITWSKDRLAPMLRDTPNLQGKVKDARSRDSGNTLLHKQFAGGHITMAGANSPASLASRPIRIVLCDEVDRYPVSAGAEGDPVSLAKKRSITFHNALLILTSTPTTKGHSRIEKAFFKSDQRYYLVPCPLCSHKQKLNFWNLKYALNSDKNVITNSVKYRCASCKETFSDKNKMAMLRQGEWTATAPFNGTAGFHINELYSPWVRWHEIVQNYLDSKDDPELYKSWVNTSLGETYEEEVVDSIKPEVLMKRREKYSWVVPEQARVLTAGVDVQIDRLVCQVVAWGPNNYESWVMDYKIVPGNPAEKEVWQRLDEYLLRTWEYQNGDQKSRGLPIAATFIDSGYQTNVVYRFVRPRAARHVFAVKGSSSYGLPIASTPTRKRSKIPVLLVTVGTDTAKNLLFSRLKIDTPGASYIHFPKRLDEVYFKELTAEHCIEKNNNMRWERKEDGLANEALDTYVYALAAIEFLKPQFRRVNSKSKKKNEKNENGEKDNSKSENSKVKVFRRPRKNTTPAGEPGFVNT